MTVCINKFWAEAKEFSDETYNFLQQFESRTIHKIKFRLFISCASWWVKKPEQILV